MTKTRNIRCPLCDAKNTLHAGLVRRAAGVYEQRTCKACGQVFLVDDDGHEPPRPVSNVSGRYGGTTP